MTDITAKIQLIDEVSDKMNNMAESGQNLMNSWSGMESAGSSAFDGVETSAASVATSVDGVATSVDSASSSMGGWTSAVGNYDKSALEAVYSTQELVDMGMKTSEALEEEQNMLQLCSTSYTNLENAMSSAESIGDDLNSQLSQSVELIEEVSKSDEVSAETKMELARAYQDATEAVQELENAQSAAEAAQQNYDAVMSSGTASLEEMEGAAERAQLAAEDLESANERASNATQNLNSATSQAAEEFEAAGNSGEEFGEKGESAVTTLSSALAAAGITAALKEIEDELLECAEAAETFETAVAKIETIADTSEVSISELSSELQTLSSDTGASVNELSEAAYQAISASVDTADAVSFVASANELAKGGFTDTTTAVDVLTTAINAYGLSAEDATSISDMLVETQNLGKTTVDELAQSVGKVIPLASAYNVQMDNLSTGYAELTKSGIKTVEAGTYMRSMLQELGDSSSTVAEVLQNETGQSFADLMESGYSLGDVLEVLGDSVNGDTTAFNELWSNTRAGVGALALYNAGADEFNSTLAQMQDSAGATSDAFATMEDTTEHAHEKMTNAIDNLKIAIGDEVNESLEPMYEAVANVVTKFTDFIDQHPNVVKAATGIAAGLAVVVAGLAAVAAAEAATQLATESLMAAFSVAIGPLIAVAAAVAGVIAVVSIVKGKYDDAYESAQSMTAVTRQQNDELEDLEAQYEKACDTYGETSDEASKLKYQIDDLTASIAENGQSVEELVDEINSVSEANADLLSSYQDSESAISDQQVSSLALVAKLSDLASASTQTAGSQEAMQQIINQLNGDIDGLNLTYDDLINNQDEAIEGIKAAAQAQADQQLQSQQWQEYIDLLAQAETNEQELAKAHEDTEAAADAAAEAQAAYNAQVGSDGSGALVALWNGTAAAAQAATDEFNEVSAAEEELQEQSDATNDRIAELEETLGITSDTLDDMTDVVIDDTTAAAMAFQDEEAEIEALCAAYDEAYQSALESFSGQYGLFDEAQADMDATVDAAQAALDSQLAYWQEYTANIDTLKSVSAEDLGITQENYDALISYVSDGSEEAAGLAASMAEAVNSGNTETISQLADTLGQVSEAQDTAAQETADFVTDFSGQMEELTSTMDATIDDLDLSTEATAAAKSTIDSYASQILASKQSAVDAAQSVADAVTAALQSAKTNISVSTSTSGYASGTTNSAANFWAGENGPELIIPGHAAGTMAGENMYMAGENGPELILGQPGSEVFPASETDRIISAMAQNQGVYNVSPLASSPDSASGGSSGGGTQEKKITLEINGSGQIDISGGSADPDQILEVLEDNIKPVLMQIIQTEILEEGDRSYEY